MKGKKIKREGHSFLFDEEFKKVQRINDTMARDIISNILLFLVLE